MWLLKRKALTGEEVKEQDNEEKKTKERQRMKEERGGERKRETQWEGGG